MRKTVLISLDAFYEKDIQSLPEESFIRSLLKQSAWTCQVKTVFPALTYPAHTTLITGCNPAEHGIGHNQPFQPGTEAAMRKWYWEASQVRRPSLFDAVKQAGGRCASILWPVSGKNPSIRWNFPEVLALPGENQTLKMMQYGSPIWLLSTEIRLSKKRISTKEPHLSDYGCLLACDVIRRHQPELTALHMVDLDETRHKYGTHSPEASEALKRMDDRVRRLWETVQQTPGMEDALFVLVSDHGQADVRKKVCIAEELEKAGHGGSLQVQSNGMSAYLYEGSKGKKAMAEAFVWLEQHGAEIGVSHLYSWDELEKSGCSRENPDPIEAAIEAAPEYVFSDGLPQAKREKATHGFGPGHPAENCLLAISGRNINPSRLPSMDMRDVAPTVAQAMGVRLPEATGTSNWG